MKLDAVYVTYWSLRDPLCLSQSLPVVRALARRGWRMALVTFEQAPWTLSEHDRKASALELARAGVVWRPLPYHKRPRLLATAWDILAGAWLCARLAWSGRARLVHGRATVPAAIAWAASRLTGARFFDDADGPLSEEYVDAGLWRRGSFAHRVTARAERRFLAAADAVAVLSEHRRREVEAQARSAVSVLPCGVDTALFDGDPLTRAARRRELQLSGLVLGYVGKAGGWYRTELMLDFCRAAQQTLGSLALLVLTTEHPERFSRPAAERGLRCVVRRAAREEVPGYLAACDAGLSFRLDSPSQRACSPIKNGEYLASGLPVVTTPGAGDYSELVAREGVGVVVSACDEAALREAAARLGRILEQAGLRERCRAVARAQVGLSEVVIPRYVGIYEGLLGAPKEGAA